MILIAYTEPVQTAENHLLTLSIFMPLAALSILYLSRTGQLNAQAFKSAPKRNCGLDLWDFVVAIALVLFVSQAIAAMLWPIWQGQTGPVVMAYRILARQCANVPMMVFILWRLQQTPDGLAQFGLWPRHFFKETWLGLKSLTLALPLVLGAGVLLNWMLDVLLGVSPKVVGHQILRLVIQTDSYLTLGLLVFSTVIIAPIVEEFVYRGVVQSILLKYFSKKNRWLVIYVGAYLFMLIHIPAVDAVGLVSILILALFLGSLYERTGRLWPGMILHMGFNAFNFGYVLLYLRN